LEGLVPEGALEAIMFDFMKAVHVELPDEAVDFVVAEIVGKNDLFKFDCVFYDEF
jgi:hypothetical protein